MNKVFLIGNIGRDFSLKQTAGGTQTISFPLCTSRKYKKDNKVIEENCWHNIVAFSKTAELCAKYLSKGSKVFVEGEIRNRSFDGKDGTKKYISEIVATNVQFLSVKKDNNRDDKDDTSTTEKHVNQSLAEASQSLEQMDFSDIPF